MRSSGTAGRAVSDAAWAFAGVVFLGLFGAGGYLQLRRTSKIQQEVTPAAENAQEAKDSLKALLPVIQDLQQRLDDAEDLQVETMILLAAHNEWDQRVYTEICKYDPNFPPPPPTKKLEGGGD